ncbi:MAG: sulfite oxidase [Planctomycetaceae bacterium]|nr:sulfite oxidase [Planctomycetaceae bacterium]
MLPAMTTRRDVLKTGISSVAAGLAMLSLPEFVFPGQTDDEVLVPFENVPRSKPESLDWETLTEWLTPQDQVFSVQHYDVPEVNPADFVLELGGLVDRPRRFTLDEIKALPREDQFMTLECSGNGSSPGFSNAVYNSRWTGTRLAPLLEQCGVQDGAIEVVFFCHDRKTETLRPGTPRELSVEVPFGRSLSLEDARSLNPLLAYERNGEPLAVRNGAPLRLIVPGWYGIANVKWLRRIEVWDRRYMGRYMGRDYVTVRGERHGDDVEFVERSVTRMNLKSAIARVTRRATADGNVPLKVYGAVWGDGTPITKVEVQVDGGEWREATLDAAPLEPFSWRFFSLDVGALPPGKHTLVSRGVDATGRIQPAAEDDDIALKRT